MSTQGMKNDVCRSCCGIFEAIKNLREAFFGESRHETYIAMSVLAVCFGLIYLAAAHPEALLRDGVKLGGEQPKQKGGSNE